MPIVLGTLFMPLWLTLAPVQRPSSTEVLSWTAPPECPSEEILRARIEQLAPESLARARADTRVSLSVEPEPEPETEGYALRLLLRDQHGVLRRKVVDADCEQLTQVAALMVAVFLDPSGSTAGVREARGERSPAEAPPPEAPPPEPATLDEDIRPSSATDTTEQTTDRERAGTSLGSAGVVTAPAPEPPMQLRGAVRVFGGGGYGPTNTGTGLLGGGAALLGPSWRVQLDAGWIPPRVVRPQADVGGRFDAWFVALRGCYVFHPSRQRPDALELPTCLGFEGGRVRGQGLESLPVVLEAAFNWIAPALGAGLWFAPIELVAFGVDAQLAIPIQRGRFLVEDIEVQRITPLSVRALVGVELRFPRG